MTHEVIYEFKMWAGLCSIFIIIWILLALYTSKKDDKGNYIAAAVFLGVVTGTALWGLLT